MIIQVVLKKYAMDSKILNVKFKKIGVTRLGVDSFSGRLILKGDVQDLPEIDSILHEERPLSLLQWGMLRKDLQALKEKLGSYALEIKTYSGVRIPKSTIKKKLHLEAGSGVNVLLEIVKDKGKYFYRLFTASVQEIKTPKTFKHLSVLLENPRLADELSDFLRLCLIFGAEFKIIHPQKKQATQLIGKAKSLTKGRLSDFDVEIVSSVRDLEGYAIIGFSRHVKKTEKDLQQFFLKHKNKKILLAFGNDTYGLSQEARDSCDALFHLTPDYEKPLKANQALSYVLGLYTGWFE